MNPQHIAILVVLAATTLAACAEPARRPDKVIPEVSTPTAERPAWVDGEFKAERVFWGAAGVPMTGDEAAAREAATQVATENLGAEVQLLVSALGVDHEEQVAEVISQYPLDAFEGHLAGSKTAALEKVTVVDTFVDTTREPNRFHVLVTLSPDALFTAIEVREGLPREQKKRVEDYGHVFLDSVMTNLGR